MPEATETTETVETTTTVETGEKPKPPPELQAIIDKERKNARDAEKARKALETELDQLRQQTMSDQEKAIDAARVEARSAALAEVGGKVARAEIRAAAAGRLEADALDTLLAGIDLAKFLDESGDVDTVKVQAFMDGIAPKQETNTTTFDLGQGARGGNANMALNGDPLEQDLRAKLGIK